MFSTWGSGDPTALRSPYAVLEVGIMTARDLAERDSGFFNADTTPDSFVQVTWDTRKTTYLLSPWANRHGFFCSSFFLLVAFFLKSDFHRFIGFSKSER